MLWTEVSEIKPEEMKEFIETAQAANGIGAIILDLGNAYTQFTNAALDYADEIFVLVDVQGSWQQKLETLFDRNSNFIKYYQEKINIIFNKSHGQERYTDLNSKKNIYVRNFMIKQPTELINTVAGELMGSVPRG